MSCKHGNWAPCDECDEEDAAWRTAFAAGVKKADEETARLRQQLDIAITGMTETIEDNLHLADGDNCTLIKLKQALAQIRELEK